MTKRAAPGQLDLFFRELVTELVRDEVARALAARPDEYLSVRQAAELAGVAAGTVRRWIREAKLPAHGAGRHLRVKRADLEQFLREGGKRERTLSPEEQAAKDLEDL